MTERARKGNNMDIVIFDLETTGLSPYSHEIIQIAGVRMRAGRVCENEDFATFVRPHHRIPSFITQYTGISNAHVQNAPRAEDALLSFSRFVGDATLIAHNGKRFDMPFIRESCARHELPVRPVGFIDSMSFSRKLWGGRGGHGLDAVMSRLQLSASGARRHDARGDVQILAEAVRRMWRQLTPDFHTCPVNCGSGVMPA
jgi:DNA polymerase III alpha subunit (gram-positive type)